MSRVWVSSRSLMWGGIVQVCYIVCVCVAHDVCVVLGSSLVFLAFLLCDDGKKRLSYLFYHNTVELVSML